jgi:GH25 family lysozyme M1 (1,4-beta-N-acetylmuramidase)
MQNGIDISNHQGSMDLAKVLKQTKTDFVICKSTEGLKFVDKFCDKFMVIAQNAGKQVGFYHFARPEWNSAKAEAEFFLRQTKGYFGKGIPVLDWESSGKSNVKWAKEWLDYIYDKKGVKPVIYMSESVVNAYNWKAVADTGYGLWVARYRDYNIDRNYDMSTCGKKPVVKWWSFYMMWQWTSVGRLDGYSGNLDCDVFYGDSKSWDAYVKCAQITTGGVEVEKIYAYTNLAAELPILRKGAQGNAVKLVQLVVGAQIDGSWGNETDSKVKVWETKYKLEPDGLFDKADWQVALDWLATV